MDISGTGWISTIEGKWVSFYAAPDVLWFRMAVSARYRTPEGKVLALAQHVDFDDWPEYKRSDQYKTFRSQIARGIRDDMALRVETPVAMFA